MSQIVGNLLVLSRSASFRLGLGRKFIRTITKIFDDLLNGVAQLVLLLGIELTLRGVGLRQRQGLHGKRHRSKPREPGV
jgi:hypothetical protein